MKKLFIFTVLMFTGVLSGMNLHAQSVTAEKGIDGGGTVAKAARTMPETRRFIGTVVSLDMQGQTLIARTRKGETAFDTSVARFPGSMTPGDLKPGEKVLVRYVEEDGRKVAKAILTTRVKPDREKAVWTGHEAVQPSGTPDN